ncbi:hypothetical protein Ddc_13669 [Ditylenchus destructor]|nr:hypothetical protein Ddc_13669 [Ditylenchus destructor]
MKSQENSDIRKKLEESENRNDYMCEEKEEMQEELKSWEHLRQLLGGATEYADGIRKRKAEQGLALPPVRMLEDPEEVEIRTELGSDGTSAKKVRIDAQKNQEGAGAKTSANVA